MIVVDELDERFDSRLSFSLLSGTHFLCYLSGSLLNSSNQSVWELSGLNSRMNNVNQRFYENQWVAAYLLAFIILLDDDGLLAGQPACKQDDDSTLFHAVIQITSKLISLSPELNIFQLPANQPKLSL